LKQQTVALFDLDYTLLKADSEELWCRYLFKRQLVDVAFITRIETFYNLYEDGSLDLATYRLYEEFLLSALISHTPAALRSLRNEYLEWVREVIRPSMLERVDWHRSEKHTLVMITAANSFLAEPIAQLLGFSNLICTQLEVDNGRMTGKVSGIPAFQYGKVIRLTAWLQEKKLSLKESWCYSDSHNDLPLLKLVDHPVMVRPDDVLKQHGLAQGWETFESDNTETHTTGDYYAKMA
jgi:HAD superfamily hydrolase (TIGR01490 family)